MRDRNGRVRRIIRLGAVIALAAGAAGGRGAEDQDALGGIELRESFEDGRLEGRRRPSGIRANLISARADLGLGKSIVLSLSAGLSLTDFKDLAFTSLPVSLQFDAGPISGLVLGPRSSRRSSDISDFEISGTGRFVYSLGHVQDMAARGFRRRGGSQGKAELGGGRRRTAGVISLLRPGRPLHRGLRPLAQGRFQDDRDPG